MGPSAVGWVRRKVVSSLVVISRACRAGRLQSVLFRHERPMITSESIAVLVVVFARRNRA
jgi:hypothetical protein